MQSIKTLKINFLLILKLLIIANVLFLIVYETHIKDFILLAIKNNPDVGYALKTHGSWDWQLYVGAKDSYEFFSRFVNRVADAGCKVFIIHARKAFLEGLSPKENRQIPPLRYDYVYKIKQDRPDSVFILNGGIKRLNQICEPLRKTDGIMVGREAYHNPCFVSELTSQILDTHSEQPDRFAILEQYQDYLARELASGEPLQHGARHLLGLFQGMPGAKKYRRYLSEHIYAPNAGIDTITQAANLLHRTDFIEQAPHVK